MRAIALAFALVLALSPAIADKAEFRSAEPGYDWTFPADHGSHPGYGVEWWYFTGHLETTGTPVQRFGYQFTLFRIGLVPEAPATDSSWSAANLLMGHASITAKDDELHRFSEVLYRETPFLAGFQTRDELAEGRAVSRIAWTRGPVGTAESWSLDWSGDGFDFRMADASKQFAFELTTHARKPLVFQGPGGYSRKSDGTRAGSQYYSFTRLDTSGTLSLGGRSYAVRGESWMDHEFSSSQLTEQQVGWDWFGLQLADGRELMLYSLRRADGVADYAHGTLIDRNGSPRYLGSDDWRVEIQDRWTSADTGARYPAQWRIELPGEGVVLIATPDVADQENRAKLSGRLFYWEGSVTLTDEAGNPAGQGYVELTGYGENNRPPI